MKATKGRADGGEVNRLLRQHLGSEPALLNPAARPAAALPSGSDPGGGPAQRRFFFFFGSTLKTRLIVFGLRWPIWSSDRILSVCLPRLASGSRPGPWC